MIKNSSIFFLVAYFCFSQALFASDEFGSEFDDIAINTDIGTTSTLSDPFEKGNRVVHSVYKFSYTYFVKYVATAYSDYTPSFVQSRANDFVVNMGEPRNFIAHLSQGRINAAVETAFRFIFNSTIGVFGLFDIMGAAGLPTKYNDLGATLYFLGVPAGPYLTIIGPTNLRDFSAFMFFNIAVDPFQYQPYPYKVNLYKGYGISYSTFFVIIDYANLYTSYQFYIKNSLDEYNLVKNTYYDTRQQVLANIALYD